MQIYSASMVGVSNHLHTQSIAHHIAKLTTLFQTINASAHLQTATSNLIQASIRRVWPCFCFMEINMFDNLNEYRMAAERHYQKRGYTFEKDNLSKIISVMNDTFSQYSRVFAFRVDLHFPDNIFTRMLSDSNSRYHGAVLKAFFAELEKLFVLDQIRQATNGKRVRKTEMRYVWAREQTAEAAVPHYHLMFFLNGEAYCSLGNFKSKNMNLVNKIRVAWHRAVFEEDLSIDFCMKRGLVQFSEKGQHEVFSDDPIAIKKVLLHAAYLAKRETKRRGEGYQCFGGTNK